MKIKRLKELIKNVPDDVDVYFMFGLNDKYEDKENGVFTLNEETYVYFSLTVTPSTDYDIYLHLMLIHYADGASISPYEPYENIGQFTDYDNINIFVSKKNLLFGFIPQLQ